MRPLQDIQSDIDALKAKLIDLQSEQQEAEFWIKQQINK